MSKDKAKGKPIDKVERVLFQTIASMSGWDVARHYKCGYSGDMDPVRHGGFFYDARDWESWGYASCVEFWEHPDTGHLHVTCGTINKPHDDNMERMWDSIGQGHLTKEQMANPHYQICVAREYFGIEPTEDFGGPYSKTFDLETWQEWRIWRSVHGWLKALGE